MCLKLSITNPQFHLRWDLWFQSMLGILGTFTFSVLLFCHPFRSVIALKSKRSAKNKQTNKELVSFRPMNENTRKKRSRKTVQLSPEFFFIHRFWGRRPDGVAIKEALHILYILEFDDDCFYYHPWRNNLVIAFGILLSFLTWSFFISSFLFFLPPPTPFCLFLVGFVFLLFLFCFCFCFLCVYLRIYAWAYFATLSPQINQIN